MPPGQHVIQSTASSEVVVQRIKAALPVPLVSSVQQTAAEAAVDPQVRANAYVVDTGTSPVVASPAQFDDVAPTLGRAPDHGEHTEEVLLALGRGWDEILRLKESRVVN